jgi:hypothetical protein
VKHEHEILPANDLTLFNKDYIALQKLEYFRPNVVRLDLPFILTEEKMLVFGMPYLKLEGEHSDSVRLLDIWDEDGYVFLRIEMIKSGMVDTISWSLAYVGDYWLWSIVTFDCIKVILTEGNFEN